MDKSTKTSTKKTDTVAVVKKALGKTAKPISAIAEAAKLSLGQARTAINKLREAGAVVMTGTKRTAVYTLA